MNSPAPSPPLTQGAIERITPDAVRGWAVWQGEAARLSVRVNDMHVATLTARLERPELGQAGLPLLCGFGHRFAEALLPGDRVEVCLQDGRTLPHRNGMIDNFSPAQIAGWAIEGEPDAATGATLDIIVNGATLTRITADRPRPDLEKRGFPRISGFLHRFDPPLTPGSEVFLRFTDGLPLKGSPKRLETVMLGSLDRCTTLRIGGWASQGGAPVTVDILVNGTSIAQVLADRERPDLAAKGLPIHSGFLFTPPQPLALTDLVSVRLPNGAALRNAPRHPGHQQDGALDMCSNARVVGWAAQDGAPAELEILINGAAVARLRCDVPRHDLAARGLPVLSGFAALLPREAGPEDEIGVRFIDGPQLTGSPKRPGRDYLLDLAPRGGVTHNVGNSRPGLNESTLGAARGLDLFAGLAVKEALIARDGVADGFAAFQALTTLPACASLTPRKLVSLHAAPKRARAAWHMLDAGGEPYTLPAPPVIGDGNQYDLTGIGRPIFLGCLKDARLRGRSAVIELASCALVDFQGDELTRLDDRLAFDPAVFHHDGDTLHLLTPPADQPERVIPEAFHLLGAHTDAFGHWLWEYLPKFLAASMSGILPPMPILIDAVQPFGVMPASHRALLLALAPPGTEVIEVRRFETLRVEKLWVTPGQMHMPLLERINPKFRWDYLGSPPARLAHVMREMDRRLPHRAGRGLHRVFLARPASNHRRLVNKLVIEGIAQARGFEIVYPETLDIHGQAALLREADFVLGPEGSAFFLAFFARPGTQICLLDHPHTAGMTLLTAPLREIGVQSRMFTGPFAQVEAEFRHCSDYSIDEIAFAQFLDRWLAGAA